MIDKIEIVMLSILIIVIPITTFLESRLIIYPLKFGSYTLVTLFTYSILFIGIIIGERLKNRRIRYDKID